MKTIDHLARSVQPKATPARIALLLLLNGCSGTADAEYQSSNDASTDASLDRTNEGGPCWLEVQTTEGSFRNNWILRNSPTNFRLVPRSPSCHETLSSGEPEIAAGGIPLYRRSARVCINRNTVNQCIPTELTYYPGGNIPDAGNFKSSIVVGPVSFNQIPGLPSNWNAIQFPVDIEIDNAPRNLYVRTYTNFDWATPRLSNARVTTITPTTIELAFNTNEHGVWGVNIDNVEAPITCTGENEFNSCSPNNYCVLQQNGYHCMRNQWGGQVNKSGEQTVSIPFIATPGTTHQGLLFFRDLAGNATEASFTVNN